MYDVQQEEEGHENLDNFYEGGVSFFRHMFSTIFLHAN